MMTNDNISLYLNYVADKFDVKILTIIKDTITNLYMLWFIYRLKFPRAGFSPEGSPYFCFFR